MPAPSVRFLRRPRRRLDAHPQRGDRAARRRGGRGAEVAAATEAAMRGEVDFAASLRSRVERAGRASRSRAFARVLARIEPTPGVRELIDAVHERGGRVGVVSGGFHEILDTDRPRPRRGRLAGQPARRAETARSRARSTARSWMPRARQPRCASGPRERASRCARTIAIGDGANDLRMMAAAGLGLAFNAKPAVRRPGRPDHRAGRSARSDPAPALNRRGLGPSVGSRR